MFADRLFGDMAPREHPYHRGMHRDPPADPAASPTTRPTVLIGDSNSAADLALRRQIYFGEPLPAEAEEGPAWFVDQPSSTVLVLAVPPAGLPCSSEQMTQPRRWHNCTRMHRERERQMHPSS